MIFRIADKQAVEYDNAYSDVKASDWYSGYVQAAFNNNLISADEKFRPTDSITRQEAAKMIVGIVGIISEDNVELPFADLSSIDDWAVPFVQIVSGTGLMKGSERQEFLPLNSMTRAEAAAIIWRLMQRGDDTNG